MEAAGDINGVAIFNVLVVFLVDNNFFILDPFNDPFGRG